MLIMIIIIIYGALHAIAPAQSHETELMIPFWICLLKAVVPSYQASDFISDSMRTKPKTLFLRRFF